MKNVLIVNQSAELYGADKAILELIENYPVGYNPIVILHEEGPLKELLERKGIEVIKCSVIKVKRGILKPGFFLKLPFEVFKSFRIIRKQLNGRKIDLIHSNATSVFIGAFYASIFRIKHLWHVHEIIEHPKKVKEIYPKIVGLFSDYIIFNSNATSQHFLSIFPKLESKSVVIHNGQNRNFPFSDEHRDFIRTNEFKINKETIAIGLVGRISRLKGQFLLLEAFKSLKEKFNNINLIYIGSVACGQEHILNSLKSQIDDFGLNDTITIIDFQKEIWPYYDALDIVTIPSTEPESFGLVATEAMLSSKPVIASKIGGLKEIIEEGKTGYFFEPSNPIDLALQLEKLINSREDIFNMGKLGLDRVRKLFNSAKYIDGITQLYDKLTAIK